MKIQKVETKAQLKQFIELPYRLYRDDPDWVPPLRSEQKALFNPKVNLMLPHCVYDLFLLTDATGTIGRIAAFYDRTAVQYWKEPIGLCREIRTDENQRLTGVLR